MAFTVTVTTQLSNQDIADLVTTALEGGSNDWIESIDFGKTELQGHARYSDPAVYDGDFKFTICVEEDDDGPYKFDREAVQKGLDLLFSSDVEGYQASARSILPGYF